MNIREYRHDDYDAVIALWSLTKLPVKCHGRDTREQIEKQIATGCVFLLIAEHDGQMAGTVLGSHDMRRGYVNRLAVAAQWQRAPMGVAVRLLEATEERFRLLGLEIFAALIEGHNSVSMRFFERMGYMQFEGMTYYTKRLRPGI